VSVSKQSFNQNENVCIVAMVFDNVSVCVCSFKTFLLMMWIVLSAPEHQMWSPTSNKTYTLSVWLFSSFTLLYYTQKIVSH
jgi:hypothetical protein